MKTRTKKKVVRPKATKQPAKSGKSGFLGDGSSRRGNLSWLISGLHGDMEIREGLWEARTRCRALEWENDYVRKFLVEIVSNVLGAEGMILQMKIKEQADRVVHTPDEKSFIENYQRAKNRQLEKFRKILVRRGLAVSTASDLVPDIELMDKQATVLAGQPDVYANNLIETAWKRFGRKENFTVTRELTKRETEGLHFRSTARDGAALLRKVKGFDNEFGFAIQLIDIDWLDLNYNVVLSNGNEVRMGKEYNKWKECVAYHIIKRSPGDWRYSPGIFGGSFTGNTGQRERIAADEILHPYIRERIDQSREVPWMISATNRLRMLGKYEEAELFASLAAACKIGYYFSDMNPEGGVPQDALPDPTTGGFSEAMEPGLMETLPYGVKMGLLDPKHPNGNYDNFRKGMLRGISAGLPGSTYYGLSQDQESVNFSTARMSELPARDIYIALQYWEAENVATPIFEPWLEAALISGRVPLPVSKFDKFNQPNWIGRRWKGIDLIKEAQANKMNLLLGITTRAQIIAESSNKDFEEIIFDLAIEEDLLRSLGLDALLLENLETGNPAAQPAEKDEKDSSDNESDTDMTETEELKGEMDAYGVGVRAGAITPQEEDEAAFRTKAKLPGMSAAAKGQWGKDGGVRRPITLLNDGQHPAASTQSDGDEETPAGGKNGKELAHSRV